MNEVNFVKGVKTTIMDVLDCAPLECSFEAIPVGGYFEHIGTIYLKIRDNIAKAGNINMLFDNRHRVRPLDVEIKYDYVLIKKEELKNGTVE